MADVLDQIDQTEDLDLGTATETTDADQGESEGEHQESQQPEDKIDGRRFNPEWSKALKELRELYANDPDKGPKISDMLTKLRDGFARFGAVNEIAPKGVEEIRQWKTTLDALGGSEAAAELMQRVADVEQIDARIEAADFSAITELPESMQKGVFQMLPEMLSHLATNDEKAFAAAVMPHFAAALEGTGMGEHLKAMYALAEGNVPLQEKIKQQYDWFQQQVSGKGNIGGTKTVDPQVTRLQAELDQRRQADDEAFVGGIIDSTNKHMGDWFDKNSTIYAKQLNLTEQQKADLRESWENKLAAKLEKDTAFQAQLKAYGKLKNRNPQTVNDYIKSTIEQESNAKTILDGLVTARYGGTKRQATTKTATATTTDNGATRVAQTPPREEWDMDKMDAAGYDATAKIGKFFLKGGRTVQVVRQ